MATQSIPKISEEEYLERERAAQFKSEFIGGEMFAMPGGSLRHSRLAMNWGIELGIKLRGSACAVFNSDAKVRTPVTGSFLYPDVSVVCGTPEMYKRKSHVMTNPQLIVEVLSRSTANYDRGTKFELYREIASLQEHVLAHTDAVRVEHFARQPDSSWVFREYFGPDSTVTLSSIGSTIRLAEVYAGVLETPA